MDIIRFCQSNRVSVTNLINPQRNYRTTRTHYVTITSEGDENRVTLTEFNSENTKRLNLEETKAKIASLEYIQNELKGLDNIAK